MNLYAGLFFFQTFLRSHKSEKRIVLSAPTADNLAKGLPAQPQGRKGMIPREPLAGLSIHLILKHGEIGAMWVVQRETKIFWFKL